MNEDIKQYIIIRSDLKNKQGQKVRSGKLMAQVAHASMAFMNNRMRSNKELMLYGSGKFWLNYYERVWIEGIFTKVCLRVDSEKELLDIYEKAGAEGLEVYLITDSGLTEFSEPTNTCIAIGPDLSDKISKVTGHLSLF